jgi:hypothetical protein
MTYMNSNDLPFSNPTEAYLVRPLGALEEFLWLLDQSRPAHFVMAAEVSGSTTLSDWCRFQRPWIGATFLARKAGRFCYQRRYPSSQKGFVTHYGADQPASTTRSPRKSADLGSHQGG